MRLANGKRAIDSRGEGIIVVSRQRADAAGDGVSADAGGGGGGAAAQGASGEDGGAVAVGVAGDRLAEGGVDLAVEAALIVGGNGENGFGDGKPGGGADVSEIVIGGGQSVGRGGDGISPGIAARMRRTVIGGGGGGEGGAAGEAGGGGVLAVDIAGDGVGESGQAACPINHALATVGGHGQMRLADGEASARIGDGIVGTRRERVLHDGVRTAGHRLAGDTAKTAAEGIRTVKRTGG